jgi:mannitol/fructose-specific phosphotransferase system IIA component (Ntr-type)
MRLTELFVPETVVIDFPPAGKEALLATIVRDMDEKGLVTDGHRATEDVIARERVMSTGVGNGAAIPHAYTDGVDRLVASFYRTSAGVDFAAPDAAPVRLFFVKLSPRASRREHIRLLAKISRLLGHAEFRDAIGQARDADAVVAAFRRFGER